MFTTRLGEAVLHNMPKVAAPYIIRFAEVTRPSVVQSMSLGTMTVTEVQQEQPDRDPNSTVFSAILS